MELHPEHHSPLRLVLLMYCILLDLLPYIVLKAEMFGINDVR